MKCCEYGPCLIIFGFNLLTVFCKLDHFIDVNKICHIVKKRFSFEKIVSKFTPKKFLRITLGANLLKQIQL